jgi:hypothetical protein
MLRTVAEFSCDMPYDAVEDGGDFIEAPGRTVAEALAEIAAGRGCAATQVASVGDHGWLFHLRFRSAEVACEVTAIDGLVAQFFGPEGDRGAASPTHADFVEALTMIGEAIAADRRFRDFGWFTPEEATSEQVGAATPTGAYDAAPCFRTFGPPPRKLQADELPPAPARLKRKRRWTDNSPAPVRRSLARLFDFHVVTGSIWAGAGKAAAWVAPGVHLPAPPGPVFGISLVLVAKCLVCAFVNALFLWRTSTTPGKWLCGLEVVRRFRRRIGFGVALRREVEAWTVGCALFISPLAQLAIPFSVLRIAMVSQTSWDRRCDATVVWLPGRTADAALTFTAFAIWAAVAFRLFLSMPY